MGRFAEMFRQSPFQPLREHMAPVMACVRLVKPMFDSALGGNRDQLVALTKDVFKTEHEADIIKDEFRQTIPKTFYLPVFRGDLLGYVKLQDDMADSVEDIAVLLTLKALKLPDNLCDEAKRYVDSVVNVCELTDRLTGEFQGVVEHGMVPDRVEAVLAGVKGVEKAEWEADRIQYALSQHLFSLEGDLSPVDIMLWFKIFGELGQLANHAESLADRVRRMLTSR